MVSKKWKDLMSCHKKLCFPYDIFYHPNTLQNSDRIVMQMVSSVEKQLEELELACPFTRAGLASLLSVTGSSLKYLDLRVLEIPSPNNMSYDECLTKLECIQAARNLESLRLWRVCLVRPPKWDAFHKLTNLETRMAKLEDSVLREAFCATPNLTRIVLCDCEGLTTISIELLELRHCQLHAYCPTGWSLTLRAPKLQYLRVKGSSRIKVHNTNCLKSFYINSKYQVVTTMDFEGKLMALESLCIRGTRWPWDVIAKMLQLTTYVKHLHLEFDFKKDFQEIDFVDFFKTHPELKSFHVRDGILDALYNSHTTLKTVDPDFVIPCLEEVLIDLNASSLPYAKKATRMLESLLKYGKKLNTIKVNSIHVMDFSKEILRFRSQSMSRPQNWVYRTSKMVISLLTNVFWDLMRRLVRRECTILWDPTKECHVIRRVPNPDACNIIQNVSGSYNEMLGDSYGTKSSCLHIIQMGRRRRTYDASSSVSLTRMDSLPDGVVEYILSKLSHAKDVVSCNCVSKKWKDLMSYHKRLSFPFDIFDNLTTPRTPDSIVMPMVSSASQLEELAVAFPLTRASLASWLSTKGSSLKDLELHVLELHCPDNKAGDESLTKLECIQAARNLESLRLQRTFMVRAPKWDGFHKLRNLEIRMGKLEDSVLREALRATPNLTRLVLGDCEGLTTISIELLELRHCELDVYCLTGWSLTLRAPKIQYLEVKGCNQIKVHDTNCLKTLSIRNDFKVVTMVDFGGNLMALESLCIGGFEWRWDVITKMLQLTTHVKHLRVEIGFIKDFREIDFVDFFKTRPKLESFHIVGDVFLKALCNNHTTLKNVDLDFVFPCLEEVIIHMDPTSLSDVEKVTRMVESLLKYGNKLNTIKVNSTRAMHFSKETLRFRSRSMSRLQNWVYKTSKMVISFLAKCFVGLNEVFGS
ncbi:hypothetical protein OSB04_030415 [Centaurea solstitialis]|uniref:F-box domain-containing protein n=1 Tax=Centaurea solstitialis TaxID=347529 RepID=A0AA38VT87_9ASTR|nr:hypothetical protein OSB04_030415 [Centaurea solstitialis]